MTQKIGYEIDGNVVTTLPELADLLGVEKITKKDITGKGKYADLVGIVDLAGDDDSEGTEEPKNEEIYTSLSQEDMKNLESVDVDEIKGAFPEFEDIDELKEFIKDIDTPTLEYLATGLGLEWNPTYHQNIHRMRIAMELQKYFFPELFKPKESKKKKAKYGDYDTNALFKLAEDNKIEIKRSGNDPIDRMKAIMKLKAEGVLAE